MASQAKHERGEAFGQPRQTIVGPGPVATLVSTTAAPHRVGGVGKAVERGARQPGHGKPEQQRHQRVIQILGQSLARALPHLRGVEG